MSTSQIYQNHDRWGFPGVRMCLIDHGKVLFATVLLERSIMLYPLKLVASDHEIIASKDLFRTETFLQSLDPEPLSSYLFFPPYSKLKVT